MKQSIRVLNYPIKCRVIIPGSKSMTNRALMLAAFAEGASLLSGILCSEDTHAFMQGLQALGVPLLLVETEKTCRVVGGMGRFPNQSATIWCQDAGTVARFLLAACAISPGVFQFDGTQQLRHRPMAELVRVLATQGVKFTPPHAKALPIEMIGQPGWVGGEMTVDATETGQYVSALLMIAPFAQQTVTINAPQVVGATYIDMTCAMMADFGVLVKRMHQTRFTVPVPQHYRARHYVIEPDLSTASYFFAAAAVTGGEITIQPLDRQASKQGDIKFLTVLEKMGCTVEETANGLTVTGQKELRGVNVDMRDFSDTFMTLAAIAPFATTPTTITNIQHTRLQESNRIEAMRAGLEKLKIKVETGPDWIKVFPSIPEAATIDSCHDHRIAMSFAIIGLRVPGVAIDNIECVAKSCPEFFALWEALQ